MKQCLYDNPATYCREVWRDGEMVQFWSAELILQKYTRLKQPPFAAGKFWDGDETAMKREEKKS